MMNTKLNQTIAYIDSGILRSVKCRAGLWGCIFFSLDFLKKRMDLHGYRFDATEEGEWTDMGLFVA